MAPAETPIPVEATKTTEPGPAVVDADSIFDNPDLVDAIFSYIVAEFPELTELTQKMAKLKQATRREFSGIETYIPRRSQAERDRLAKEVLCLFNGRNATEIARRLGIGRATVYRIIKTDGEKKIPSQFSEN